MSQSEKVNKASPVCKSKRVNNNVQRERLRNIVHYFLPSFLVIFLAVYLFYNGNRLPSFEFPAQERPNLRGRIDCTWNESYPGSHGDFNQSGPIVGIEFGDTESRVAYYENGNPIFIRSIPNFLALDDEGALIWDKTFINCSRQAVFDIKALFGTFKDAEHLNSEDLPFEIREGSRRPYLVSKINQRSGMYSVDSADVAAAMISRLRVIAEKELQTSIGGYVISVPSSFDKAQRDELEIAAMYAGPETLHRVIDDSVAVGLAYGLDTTQNREETALVMKIDHDSIDIDVLQIEEGMFKTLTRKHERDIGGNGIMSRHIGFLAKRWLDETWLKGQRETLEDYPEMITLKKEIQRRGGTTDIVVRDWRFSLTREIYFAVLRNPDKDMMEVVEATIEDARTELGKWYTLYSSHGTPPENLVFDKIILTGGSATAGNIMSYLGETSGVWPLTSPLFMHKDAIAIGAARQGDILRDPGFEHYSIQFTDVLYLNLGVETIGGIMTPVLHRGTKLPAHKMMMFTTAEDDQEEVSIVILEGQRALRQDNNPLGNIKIRIPPASRAMTKIEVNFDIDRNGTLDVSVAATGTGEWGHRTMGRDLMIYDNKEIRRLVEEADTYAEKDEQVLRETENALRLGLVKVEGRGQIAFLKPDLPDDWKRLLSEGELG